MFHDSEYLEVNVWVNYDHKKKIFVRKVSRLVLLWKKKKRFHSSGRKAVLISDRRKK